MARTKTSSRPFRNTVHTALCAVKRTLPKTEWTRGIREALRKYQGPFFLSKHFPDLIRKRNKWIREADSFGDTTVVAETSIYETGRGLYSLCAYERGDMLPFTYPGKSLLLDEHEGLCDFLLACTQQTEWDANAVNAAVSRLYDDWGVELVQREALRVPYWDCLYDSFVAYRFATSTHMFYWPAYTWTGHVWALGTTPVNAPIFINEPTHFSHFYNRVKERVQISRANLESVLVDGVVRFRAIRKINRWDELLMHYGPEYNRPYAQDPTQGTYTAPGVFLEQFNQLIHKCI